MDTTDTVAQISDLLRDLRTEGMHPDPARRAAWFLRKAAVMEAIAAEDPRQAETARASAEAARREADRLHHDIGGVHLTTPPNEET